MKSTEFQKVISLCSPNRVKIKGDTTATTKLLIKVYAARQATLPPSIPVIFTLLGEHSDMTFWNSVLFICRQVMPVLILPFALALFLEKALPSLHRQLKKLQILSFYLWALGLTIVTGKTVYFIVYQENADITEEWWMAALALVITAAAVAVGAKTQIRPPCATTGSNHTNPP